jgi:phenylacetate-CoA ligase
MLRAAIATTRLAASVALGRRLAPWSLDWIVSAMLATHAEFGALDARLATGAPAAAIDERSLRDVQLRRVRELIALAHQTGYYAGELATTDNSLDWPAFQRLSVTPKAALRDDPDAFVHRAAQVVLRTATTGTTGRPTVISFSAHELATLSALAAISFLARGDIVPGDAVQICSSPRALGTATLAGACARLGAVATVSGAAPPAETLEHLAVRRGRRAGVLSCYPSYLGELVEEARRRGIGRGALSLARVLTGGELVTAGLRRRAREALGDIEFAETYALTETLPLGGMPCSHGHLHFESSHGLVEVIAFESGKTARAGELGTLVLTPFPPFRETTLLLRYDSEDLVRPVTEPLTCDRQSLPVATSHIQGKLGQAIPSEDGLVCAREILEPLEDLDAVPLPARYAARALDGGVALDVVVRDATTSSDRRLRAGLEEAGVPVRRLRLVEDARRLQSPVARRCDLREPAYAVEGV